MTATLCYLPKGHSLSATAECFGCSHGEGVRERDRRSAGMLGIAWVGGAKSATGNRATRCGCASHQWGCRHRQQRPFQPRATPCAAAAVWQDPGRDAGEGGQARPRVRERVALLLPVPPDLPLPFLSPPCILRQPPPSAASGTPAHPSPMRAHPRATVSSRARAPPSPPTVPVGAAVERPSPAVSVRGSCIRAFTRSRRDGLGTPRLHADRRAGAATRMQRVPRRLPPCGRGRLMLQEKHRAGGLQLSPLKESIVPRVFSTCHMWTMQKLRQTSVSV